MALFTTHRKTYFIIWIILFCILFFGFFGLANAEVYTDDFDSYTLGDPLTNYTDYWLKWDADSCYVDDTYTAQSGTKIARCDSTYRIRLRFGSTAEGQLSFYVASLSGAMNGTATFYYTFKDGSNNSLFGTSFRDCNGDGMLNVALPDGTCTSGLSPETLHPVTFKWYSDYTFEIVWDGTVYGPFNFNDSNGTPKNIMYEVSGGSTYYFDSIGSAVSPGPVSTTTEIMDVTPTLGTTTATSTSYELGADVFVTSEVWDNADYGDNPDFKLKYEISNNYFNRSQMVGPMFAFDMPDNAVHKVYTIDLNNGFGEYNWSTTTSITTKSDYDVNVKLYEADSLGDDDYDKVTGTVTIGGEVSIDQNMDEFTQDLKSGVTDTFATSSVITSKILALKDEFLYKFPWGYGTIFYDLATKDDYATTSLPSLKFTTATSMPVSGSLDLTPWTYISNTFDKMKNKSMDTEQGNFFDTALYYWNLIWYLLFGFWAFFFIVRQLR